MGTIQIANLGCNGNEASLLNCTNQGSGVCFDHTMDAGVDCAGRFMRKLCII